jgi:two-component system, OmpR family, response regulator
MQSPVLKFLLPQQQVESGQNALPRICHIGDETAKWSEIRRSMAQRNLGVSDSVRVDRALQRYAPDFPDLMIVSESESPQLQAPHEVCGDIRRNGYTGPILVVAGASDPVEPILALENGADAWIPMDADPRTAVAQIRALLRWFENAAPPAANQSQEATDLLRVGAFVLSRGSRECMVSGEPVSLTGCEFQLLWALAERAGTVVKREELMRLMGPSENQSQSRSIDSCVARLRKRLGTAHGRSIKTVRSVGYMLSKTNLSDSSRISSA